MAETLLEKFEEDFSYLQKLVFSDESTFYLNGCVNRHNCRIWGTEPPKETIDRVHSSPKVNVWMAMSASRIYGPFLIDGNITGDKYLDMLRRCFYQQLSRRDKHDIVFQQDGAPAHYARIVRDFLNEKFPER